MKSKYLIYIALLMIGGIVGYFINNSSDKSQTIEQSDNQIIEASDNQIWTCAMHPQIRKSEPGDCPICGMELIPLSKADHALDPSAVKMSPTAMELADVSTAIVGKFSSGSSINLIGKVQKDERLVYSQSSHIPGRLEKLMVNFTGEFVRKDQTIAEIYSPELVTAQEELFEAQKMEESQPQLFQSAKEKLNNWKLNNDQIDEIIKNGKPLETFPIKADVSGYVTQKFVQKGDYIKKGESIYEITDLSKVWVMFDVYETDINSIQKGDPLEFSVKSLPGQKFKGTVVYIDPLIDSKTRVAKARVEISNKDLKLKPGMFASAELKSGTGNSENTISIPKSAVMWTGKRSVVYVKDSSSNGIYFKLREVVLGQETSNSYIIESGLNGGEEIAVNGAFSIDAAAQLAGKPSMMNPEGALPVTGHHHGMKEQTTESHSNSNTKHIEFRVSGNCSMCKERIESAVKNLEGIYSANWNVDTKMMHVEYNPDKISEMEIHKKIAGVGHDTEKLKADEQVYNKLPGCCQYPKNNNH